MARKMSLKQRLHFGSSRVRAAAKQALKRRRKNSASPKRHKVHRRRTQAAPRRNKAARRRNIGEVVYLLGAGNPARKRGNMAKRRKRAGSHRRKVTNSGRRRRVMNVSRRRHASRRNPSGKIMSYVVSGAAVIGGAVGSKVGTSLVLGTKNTGMIGYLGNAVATGVLGFAAHKMFADKSISQMVIAGGIAQIIVRFMTDQTPYGSYLSGAGVGDYQTNWNFASPQRVSGYPPTGIIQPPGWGAPAATTAIVTHSTGVGALHGGDWN